MKVAPEELAKGEFMHVRANRTSGINRKRATAAFIAVGGVGRGIFTCVNFVFHYLEGREGQDRVLRDKTQVSW